MPTWVKILLISLGVFTVVVAVVSGGFWWWQQNRDAVISGARSIGAEGTRFAVGKNQQDCVDEAVTRVKGAGVIAGLKAEVFLTTCLGAAQPVAAFCDGVPKPDEFLKSIHGTRSTPRTMGSALPKGRSWCKRSSTSAPANSRDANPIGTSGRQR